MTAHSFEDERGFSTTWKLVDDSLYVSFKAKGVSAAMGFASGGKEDD